MIVFYLLNVCIYCDTSTEICNVPYTSNLETIKDEDQEIKKLLMFSEKSNLYKKI